MTLTSDRSVADSASVERIGDVSVRSASENSRQPSTALKRRSEIALFLLAFAVFFLSPIKETDSDPKYSILVSDSILTHGTPALNGIGIPGVDKTTLQAYPDLRLRNYQLEVVNGKIQYSYPPGSSLLSLPFVAVLNAADLSAIDAKGRYDERGEIWIQKIISSFLMAFATCLFFESAFVLLPWSWSIGIAVGAAFGTQIWSTATRALWSLTWEAFLAACLVLILLKRSREPNRRTAAVLATLVSWMYFVRPDGAIVVVAVSGLVFFRYRSELLTYLAIGLSWLGAFLAYAWVNFGAVLPSYYRQGSALRVHGWIAAFAGCLISPSRGLLVFVPSVLSVAFMVVRYRKELPERGLVWLATGITGGQLILIAAWPDWWGGVSYGPRLLTGVVPWLVLLAILGCRACLDSAGGSSAGGYVTNSNRWTVAIASLLTAIAIVINGHGALSVQTIGWNMRRDIDNHPERLWDWSDSQLLAGWINPSSGTGK